MFIKGELIHNGANSEKNRSSVTALDSVTNLWNQKYPDNEINYFGTFLIADVNAVQIAKDVRLTLTIAIISIILLLVYYYRKPIILVFFMIPGVFGILSAFGFIYWYQGGISGLALAASAIVFGIVADYSFHFFTNFKQNKSAYLTKKEIFFPLLISGTTTIVAFFSLVFAESKTLQDFGLFTSLSLAGTLFFVLTGLPILLSVFESKIHFPKSNGLDKWLNKIKIGETSPKKAPIILIVVLTFVFLYFGLDVKFEDDLQKINFYPEELKAKELVLQNIDPDQEKRISILASGTNHKSAALVNRNVYQKVMELKELYQLKEIGTTAPIWISQEEQKSRIAKWNQYWSTKKEPFIESFINTAEKQNWKTNHFRSFFDLLSKPYVIQDLSAFISESNTLQELTLFSGHDQKILTTLVCPTSNIESVKSKINQISGVTIIDGSSIASKIIESVKGDFNFLLLYASLAVFIAFLIIYGNLELTLISFIPMVISWIWLIGIASLIDVKFNFINIILTTFIFGLGDDFSIFITDGLINRYKYKKEVLGHYKAGIVLSSISTIVGTGVLIFAQHPALKSIAALSVIGILVIVFITFYVQPILFRFFILNRTDKGKEPYSILNLMMTFIGYSFFIGGSLLVVAYSFIIRVLPLVNENTKKYWVHWILSKFSGLQLDILVKTNKRYIGMENLNYDKPSIIIANHTSFFDIIALLRLYPKTVMVVNEWVYNSPLFGPAIRYADFIPSFKEMKNEIPKIKTLIAKGYSLVIFPEGKRSEDGKLGRFHKGAFYLAEELQLDITPVILHGHARIMPKHEYYLRSGPLDTVILPRIAWNDPTYGEDYRERTKKITKQYKVDYQTYLNSPICAKHTYHPLATSFSFKSPVLPWYFRIKWKFEKEHYENYNQIIGLGDKKIFDLGCGYGYLSYFLWLRDKQRNVIGFDFDEEKVDLANNSYLKSDKILFQQGDISNAEIVDADAIILADVLHYLSADEQLKILDNCNKGLNDQGVILIRDGVADDVEKHKWTKKSEKWSTQLVKFNKTKGDLHFFTSSFIESWASKNDYSLTIEKQSKKSSNTLFVLRKN